MEARQGFGINCVHNATPSELSVKWAWDLTDVASWQRDGRLMPRLSHKESATKSRNEREAAGASGSEPAITSFAGQTAGPFGSDLY